MVGTHVYGDDIKLADIDKGFDYGKLARRYSKAHFNVDANVENNNGMKTGKSLKEEQNEKTKTFFDSRGISYELSMGSQIDRAQTTTENINLISPKV